MHNWSDEAHYRKTRTRAQWTWEFMRRNHTYRQDYASFDETRKAVPRKGFVYFIQKKEHDFFDQGRALCATWGQRDWIANPAREEAPAFVPPPFEPTDEDLGAYFDDGLQDGEFVTLTFDLRHPVPPQLERAAKVLMRRRKQRGVVVLKPKRWTPSRWRLYLQILDAEEAGLTRAEMKTKIGHYWRLYKDDKRAVSNRLSDNLEHAYELREYPLSLLL